MREHQDSRQPPLAHTPPPNTHTTHTQQRLTPSVSARPSLSVACAFSATLLLMERLSALRLVDAADACASAGHTAHANTTWSRAAWHFCTTGTGLCPENQPINQPSAKLPNTPSAQCQTDLWGAGDHNLACQAGPAAAGCCCRGGSGRVCAPLAGRWAPHQCVRLVCCTAATCLGAARGSGLHQAAADVGDGGAGAAGRAAAGHAAALHHG